MEALVSRVFGLRGGEFDWRKGGGGVVGFGVVVWGERIGGGGAVGGESGGRRCRWWRRPW